MSYTEEEQEIYRTQKYERKTDWAWLEAMHGVTFETEIGVRSIPDHLKLRTDREILEGLLELRERVNNLYELLPEIPE